MIDRNKTTLNSKLNTRISDDVYWTSTESSTNSSEAYDFSSSSKMVEQKDNPYRVILIREF